MKPDPLEDPCGLIDCRQGVIVGTLGAWLSPGMPRSVAPSGMLEPTTDPDDPGLALATPDEPVPILLLLTDDEAQLFDCVDPPPSKAAFELALGHGMTSGLTPGVLMPVAPSGMLPPVKLEPDEELSDDIPSGDVAPMPGLVVVCASAVTIPIDHTPAASTKSRYRISTSSALEPSNIVSAFH